jgi:hypothetical protein
MIRAPRLREALSNGKLILSMVRISYFDSCVLKAVEDREAFGFDAEVRLLPDESLN